VLKLVDLADGKLTGLAITPRHTDGTTFTPDGKAVLVAEGRRLLACDAATGKERPEAVEALNAALSSSRFELMIRVPGLRYSPDGKLLALALEVQDLPSGSDVAEIALWDVQAQKVRAVLRGHTGTCFEMAFTPDGKVLATGALDRTVKLWKLPPSR